MSIRPALATNVITGCLTLYYLLHLNAGAIIAYATTDEISRTLPYMAWFASRTGLPKSDRKSAGAPV